MPSLPYLKSAGAASARGLKRIGRVLLIFVGAVFALHALGWVIGPRGKDDKYMAAFMSEIKTHQVFGYDIKYDFTKAPTRQISDCDFEVDGTLATKTNPNVRFVAVVRKSPDGFFGIRSYSTLP